MVVRGGRTLARALSRFIFKLHVSYRTVCKAATDKPSISGENNHFERFQQIFWALFLPKKKKPSKFTDACLSNVFSSAHVFLHIIYLFVYFANCSCM
jgi:hypothetical protein